ncbi:Formyl-coenzyme A transferase [compost metagenome]
MSDSQWVTFCDAFGFDDLKQDPAMATNNDRVRLRPTLLADLRQRLARFGAAELAAIFERIGLPFAPIVKPEELYDDPHLLATGGLADIRLPDGERAGQMAGAALFPLMMDGERLGVRRHPPVLGADTNELLQGLGYDAGQIAALREQGAVA